MKIKTNMKIKKQTPLISRLLNVKKSLTFLKKSPDIIIKIKKINSKSNMNMFVKKVASLCLAILIIYGSFKVKSCCSGEKKCCKCSNNDNANKSQDIQDQIQKPDQTPDIPNHIQKPDQTPDIPNHIQKPDQTPNIPGQDPKQDQTQNKTPKSRGAEETTQALYEKEIGLKNLNNTCFINAVLNSIIHNKIFIKKFIEDFNKSDKKVRKPVAEAFYKFLNDYINTTGSYMRPEEFLKAIQEYNEPVKQVLQENKQGDSQEMLLHLLDTINDEFKKERKFSGTKYVGKKVGTIQDIFVPDIEQTTYFNCTCEPECKSKMKKCEPALTLIKKDGGDENIGDAFGEFFREEELEITECCTIEGKGKQLKLREMPEFKERYPNNRKGRKINKIMSLSPILWVNTGRYGISSTGKTIFLSGKVSGIKNINEIIKKYISDEVKDTIRNVDYKLASFICHRGTLEFGHYYCYAETGDGWYKFNDETATRIDDIDSKIEDEAGNVYMIFYNKV